MILDEPTSAVEPWSCEPVETQTARYESGCACSNMGPSKNTSKSGSTKFAIPSALHLDPSSVVGANPTSG